MLSRVVQAVVSRKYAAVVAADGDVHDDASVKLDGLADEEGGKRTGGGD